MHVPAQKLPDVEPDIEPDIEKVVIDDRTNADYFTNLKTKSMRR
jgi:hypothetical protein